MSAGVWGWPGASRKAHIFPADMGRSFCGKWLYFGRPEMAQGTDPAGPQSDDCAECYRRAKRDGLLPGAVPAPSPAGSEGEKA